jgi:hypothetical protein
VALRAARAKQTSFSTRADAALRVRRWRARVSKPGAGARLLTPTDRLAEDDGVRPHPCQLKPPEHAPQPAEAALDLVGDAHRARGAHFGVDGGQVALREEGLRAGQTGRRF